MHTLAAPPTHLWAAGFGAGAEPLRCVRRGFEEAHHLIDDLRRAVVAGIIGTGVRAIWLEIEFAIARIPGLAIAPDQSVTSGSRAVCPQIGAPRRPRGGGVVDVPGHRIGGSRIPNLINLCLDQSL